MTSLNKGNWTLYFGQQDEHAPTSPDELLKSNFQKIPAQVPGNVEIDLQNAGIIENPEIGNNVYKLRNYETCQWWYHRRFKQPKV